MASSDQCPLSTPTVAVLVIVGLLGVLLFFAAIYLFIAFRRALSTERRVLRREVGIALSPPPGVYEGSELVILWQQAFPNVSRLFVRFDSPTTEAAFSEWVANDRIQLPKAGKYVFETFAELTSGETTEITRHIYKLRLSPAIEIYPPEHLHEEQVIVKVKKRTLRDYTVVCTTSNPPIEITDEKFNQEIVIDTTGHHEVILRRKYDPDEPQAGFEEHRKVYLVRPAPPNIVPGSGDILEGTRITIVPRHTRDIRQIKYSVAGRGTDLTEPYTGFFYPPATQHLDSNAKLIVRAIAIGRYGTSSDIAEAALHVHSSAHAIMDKNIPIPNLMVTATNPRLGFEHPSLHDGSATPDFRIKYRLTLRRDHTPQAECEWRQGFGTIPLLLDEIEAVTAYVEDRENQHGQLKKSPVATYKNMTGRPLPQAVSPALREASASRSQAPSPPRAAAEWPSHVDVAPVIKIHAFSALATVGKPSDGSLLVRYAITSRGDPDPHFAVNLPTVRPGDSISITEELLNHNGFVKITVWYSRTKGDFAGERIALPHAVFYGNRGEYVFESCSTTSEDHSRPNRPIA